MRLWHMEQNWAIGMYVGNSPLALLPSPHVVNPVLTPHHITDVKARFVADPFMIQANDRWYMFFEVWDLENGKGKIGLATSKDALQWQYNGIVLDEPFHLSYPFVFQWEGAYYMMPECYEANSIRLYKATDFPFQWSLSHDLISGGYLDATILYHVDTWWLFAADAHSDDTLHLFFASALNGHWSEHPKSPIVQKDPLSARPAGRIILWDGRLIRYCQVSKPHYGAEVRAFEITSLGTREYHEQAVDANPILKGSGGGWNADGMHHSDAHQVDADKWLACVDGHFRTRVFRPEW